MDEFVTHQTMTTADSIQCKRQVLYWPDAMHKNVICQHKYTSSRKLKSVKVNHVQVKPKVINDN